MPAQADNTDIGKAYLDLSNAEQQTEAVESQLKSLEEKLDAFLAEHDASETANVNHEAKNDSSKHPTTSGDISKPSEA